MCTRCQTRWLRQSVTCPLCRGAVDVPNADVIRIEFDTSVDDREHVGITLRNAPLGVQVVHLDRRDRAYRSGLRIGDIITHVDGKMVTDHRRTVDHLDKCALEKTIILVHRRHDFGCRVS